MLDQRTDPEVCVPGRAFGFGAGLFLLIIRRLFGQDFFGHIGGAFEVVTHAAHGVATGDVDQPENQ